MKTIMVVFSATHISNKIADFAIEEAIKEKARLIMLDVRERNMSGKVASMMENVGFLGKKISDQVKGEIKEIRGEVIIRALHTIQQKARERGVETELIVAKGPYIENIMRIAREKKVSIIIAQKRLPDSNQEAPFEIIYLKDPSAQKIIK